MRPPLFLAACVMRGIPRPAGRIALKGVSDCDPQHHRILGVRKVIMRLR
jgi:hypothetical protein